MTTPAGFWQRYAAWSLDAALLTLPTLLLTWSTMHDAAAQLRAAWAGLLAHGTRAITEGLGIIDPMQLLTMLLGDAGLRQAIEAFEASLWALTLPPLIVFVLLGALWHIGGEAMRWEGSFGKHLLGLRVADTNDQPIGVARAAARYFAGAASWLTLNLGHALALVPPHRRALHDWIAGTRVLAKQARMPMWARLWLAAQIAAGAAVTAWLCWHMFVAMQAIVEQALL